MEILRLFGMDASMRPLLESLFFHILLLPPLEQRLDSLIFVQEVNESYFILFNYIISLNRFLRIHHSFRFLC